MTYEDTGRKAQRFLEEARLPPNLDRVDLALVLMRAGYVEEATTLTGVPVTRCPSASAIDPIPAGAAERAQYLHDWVGRHPDPWDIDNWHVTDVKPPGSGLTSVQRRQLSLVQAGRTVHQLIRRGLSYDFIDLAQRRGWFHLEAARHGQ